jgi:hypothetical protein
MTDPVTPSSTVPPPPIAPGRARFPAWLIPSVITLLLALFVMRQCAPLSRALLEQNRTTISHSSVIEKIQAVAKLVSSETTIRDVVVFENTRYGSTKRALVVVTGKVLVGFDLEKGTDVQIDHTAKRVRITLPPAAVIATDVIDMKTYDESRGLWNPFTGEDRDAIYREARSHLLRAALGMNAKEHANQSAKQLLTAMFSTDGYTAEVVTSSGPLLVPQPAESPGPSRP